MNHRVDYDRIAGVYNRRYETSPCEGVEQALIELATMPGIEHILEAGCGTGHWIERLSDAPAAIFGLDRSAGMLAQACRRATFMRLCHGRAEHLPFAASSLDLVYCVNAIHHFTKPARFIAETYRVLRPGGVLAVIGGEHHHRRESWYIYDYFEGVFENDQRRFPDWSCMEGWIIDAGFGQIAHRIVEEIHDPRQGRDVLADPFIEKSSCSQLALLSDAAYRAGLRRIEADLQTAETQGKMLVFQSDITLAMLIGRKH